jgi:cephalosporin hydroxylase
VSVIEKRSLQDQWHIWEYEEAREGRSWGGAKYFGIKLWKRPAELQLYQETIYEVKPALIIETGTFNGGSALYFAHLLDQLSHGRVVTIDIAPFSSQYPKHHRIEYWGGASSTLIEPYAAASSAARVADGPVMVILDSDHAQAHVLEELKFYAPLVTPGSYLVVEDTNVNGHPVFADHGPGPHEALAEWLPQNPDFRVDESKANKFGYSYNSWLRRMKT